MGNLELVGLCRDQTAQCRQDNGKENGNYYNGVI